MEDKQLRIALFVSRNKDNAGVEDFKQRRHEFLTWKSAGELMDDFADFAAHGKDREVSRFYMSVNARDPKITRDELVIKIMQQGDNFNPAHADALAVSAAAQAKSAVTKYWLFDVDTTDTSELNKVEAYIALATDDNYCKFSTYNNYGFIAYEHFDPRPLLEAHPEVTLKKDEMKFIASIKNNVIPTLDDTVFEHTRPFSWIEDVTGD